ncbi:VanW family protein [Paenibacillus sp. TRM 82003]|nr:VanW family protein [Paenibacillus sp. TRM 82003]
MRVMREPIRRSALRLAAGKRYYTWKRYAVWALQRSGCARERKEAPLSFQATGHATPLYRKLRNVDMWLQHNKVTNVTLAAERLNGLLIRPGETFSYWRTIGKPTKRKGYKEGMVLFYGGFKPGVGGGLCQLSNLIYWMTLHTPLTVTERHRHSYDVFPDANRTQPFGSGATCAYNYLDLQIRNDTSRTYQLLVQVGDQALAGEWRCDTPQIERYEVFELEHSIKQQHWGGYTRHNKIYRRLLQPDGEWIRDEYVTENHALMMYSPLLPGDTC